MGEKGGWIERGAFSIALFCLSSPPLPHPPHTYTKNPAAAARPTVVRLTDRAGYKASGTGEWRGVKAFCEMMEKKGERESFFF